MSIRRRGAVSPAGQLPGRRGVGSNTARPSDRLIRRAVAAATFETLESRQMFCAVHQAPLWLEPGDAESSFPPISSDGEPLTEGAAAAPPLPGLPELNSFSSAPTAIYLDFNGNGSNLPYDEDGDRTSFNGTEQANITKAWQHMATYFAPFNINVTTVKPSVPTAWGLITNSLTGPGYSYVNVFPNNLTTNPQSFNPSGDARGRQSGIAHEIGHNFGLHHQSDFDLLGTNIREYSNGYDATHGPIMGVDYAQSIHKWFLGHPSNSPTNLQDDVGVIAAKIAARPNGGDGFRPDDHAGTAGAAATPLGLSNGVRTATGIIERMADADAFAFTSAAGGRMAIDVNPVNPSGLIPKIEVYDAVGNLLAAKDDADQRNTNNNDVSVPVTLPAGGTYYAVVRSHGDYGDLGQYDITATDLPDGWSTQWVGGPSLEGSYAAYDAGTGTYTVAGSGGAVWDAADQSQFAYATLTGDGSITARVASITNTAAFAKSGLQIRESLAQGARFAAVNATPTGGSQFVRRTATNANITSTDTAAAAFAPTYLRLTRTGNTFTAQRLVGTTWTNIGGPTTVTMGSTVYVGLFSYSRNGNAVNTATFDDVALTGAVNAVPGPNALPAPSGLTVSPGTGTGLNLSWADVPGSTAYAVERSIDGTDFARVATTIAGTTTYADNGLFGSMRYFYRVRALDGTGASTSSARATAVNRPNAPGNFTVSSYTTTRLILNWRDVSGDAGYRIERSTDGGATFAPLATVGTNVPSYTDNNLTAGTPYTYRVVPLNAAGDGPATAPVTEGTRLPATTGMAFTTVASNQLAFKWNPVPGATGYRIDRSTNGTTFTALATVSDPATTAYADAAVTPLGEYYYRVVGTYAQSEGLWAAPLFAAAPAAAPLPTPWQSRDVGSVAGPGAAGHANGTFTVVAAGSDIWNTADQFRYTSMALVGDGQIVARVASLENVDPWTKAGVMVRETLAANSRHALMLVSPENGAQFASRAATGGATTAPNPLANRAAPHWVRLVRTGNAVAGSVSADGATWTPAGTVTVTMAPTVFVGLALTSHASAELARATFDNVTVTTAAAAAQPVVVNAGAVQRSMVTGMSVAFDRPVARYDAGAFSIARTDGGTASAAIVATLAADGMSATLAFAGADVVGGSLPDGLYQFVLKPALIRDAAGQPAAGADQVMALHRLFGDADGDRDVDSLDSRRFRGALGTDASMAAYNPMFDYDADGDVDNLDSRLFRLRLGTGI